MTKEEVYCWLRENPVEARLVLYELIRDDHFSLSEVVKMQELSLKGLINENRRDACEGATLACIYREEMYGKGKNYLRIEAGSGRAGEGVYQQGWMFYGDKVI